MHKGFIVLIVGLSFFVVCGFSSLFVESTALLLLAQLGPMIWMLLIIAWIVFFHSRNRWPEKRWLSRLGNLFTFRR